MALKRAASANLFAIKQCTGGRCLPAYYPRGVETLGYD